MFHIALALMTAAADPSPTAVRTHSYDVLLRRIDHYVDPARIPAILARLRADRARILAAPDDAAFLAAVNTSLYAASHDRHLQLYRDDGKPSAAADVARGTFGVEATELRPDGIGVLRLSGFSNAPGSAAAIDAAMAKLAGARALVIDLRANGGGGQVSMLRLLGHVFPTRTELNGIAWRTCLPRPDLRPDACVQGPPRIERQFTEQPPRPAFATAPVVVLTSAKTFSAAEAVAYELQAHRRATIVGETTGGGGNPSAGMDLESDFVVIMPIGRMHRVTPRAGWEGTGVHPDVAVPAADAGAAAIRALQPGGPAIQRSSAPVSRRSPV